jgi:hypothetical protein
MLTVTKDESHETATSFPLRSKIETLLTDLNEGTGKDIMIPKYKRTDRQTGGLKLFKKSRAHAQMYPS